MDVQDHDFRWQEEEDLCLFLNPDLLDITLNEYATVMGS